MMYFYNNRINFIEKIYLTFFKNQKVNLLKVITTKIK